MAKVKQVPKWFYEGVKDLNLRLIDECNMSWDEIIVFWDEILKEVKDGK